MSSLRDMLYARNHQVDGISSDDITRIAQSLGPKPISELRAMDQHQLVTLLVTTFGTTLEGELNDIATKLQAILRRETASVPRRGGNRLR